MPPQRLAVGTVVDESQTLPVGSVVDERDVKLPIASGEVNIAGRPKLSPTAKDIGIGAAKGAGQFVLDLARMSETLTNPGARMGGTPSLIDLAWERDLGTTPEALVKPEGTAQTLSSLGTGALAGGALLRGAGVAGRGMQGMAERMWHSAARRPPTEPLSALTRPVLERGIGRLTEANAKAAQSASGMAQSHTAGARARAVQGIDKSYGPPNTNSMSIIGALTQPSGRALAAQGIFNAAPGVSQGGGGVIMEALMRLLGGGQ